MFRVRIYALLVIFFVAHNVKGQNICTQFLPKGLLKKCYKYEKLCDTFIFYQRSKESAYFFYVKNKQAFLKVYLIDEAAKKSNLIYKNKNLKAIKDVIKFTADNYRNIQLVEGSNDLYTQYKQIKLNDSTYQTKVVRGYGDLSHRIHTCCFIKFGKFQTYNNLWGVSELKQYDDVSPTIAQLLRLMNQAYSGYSVETIIDR